MFYRQFTPIGCILWFALITWIFFALKLYYVIFALIVVILCYNLYQRIKTYQENKKHMSEINFEPKVGEVTKICPECNNDVKRSADVCPFCGYKFN